MGAKYRAIVIGSEQLKDNLKKNLITLVDINENYNSYSEAYKGLKQKRPDMVFVELEDNKDACFDFIRYVKKRYGSTMIFLIGQNKDPDILLKGLRSGISDFIEFSSINGNLLSILKESIARFKNIEEKGEIISVFSIKGGQGVTTIATNLADHIYTLTEDNVVLLDLNFYMSDLSVFLNSMCEYSPFDLIKDLPRMDEELLFSSLTRHKRGFYFLSVPEEKVDLQDLSPEDVDDMLKVLKNYMDYIIVDLPHDFSERTISVIDKSDILLVLVQQSVPIIKSVEKLIFLFEEMGIKDKVRIVLNRYVESDEISHKDISSVLGQEIIYKIRNDYKTIISAINSGNLLNAIFPDKRVNKDIKNIAIDITNMFPVKKQKNIKDIITKFFIKRK